MSLIRSEFGKFWRKKRDLRLEPPTRISGSIDQRHLSRILDELNRTNFEFERSEEFKNFVKNPIDIDVAFVECLQKSFRTSQSSSSALLTSSTSSQMMFLFSLYFPIMILFVFVWKKLLCWNELHTKRINPYPIWVRAEFFIPHFFYLSQNGVTKLLLRWCNVCKVTIELQELLLVRLASNYLPT